MSIISSQIENGKVLYEWKNPWRIFCYDLWNWSFFYEHYREKIKVDKNWHEYILFTIEVYFSEYFLATEIDKQNHGGREPIFEKKRQEALEKNLELIHVMQRRVVIQIMKLVKYKHLLVNLKTKK